LKYTLFTGEKVKLKQVEQHRLFGHEHGGKDAGIEEHTDLSYPKKRRRYCTLTK